MPVLNPNELLAGGLGAALAPAAFDLSGANRAALQRALDPYAARSMQARGLDRTIVNGPLTYGAGGPTIVWGQQVRGIASGLTVTAGGSGYAVGDEISIAPGSGTTTGPAILRVASVSGSSVATVTLLSAGAFSAAGATVNFAQQSTTGAGTGATFSAAPMGANPTTIKNQLGFGSSNAGLRWNAVEPRANIGGSGHWGSGTQLGQHVYVEWCSDSPEIDILTLDYTSGLHLYIDGKLAAQVQTGSSGQTNIWSVKWPGATTPECHTYRLYGMNFGLYAVRVVASASLWSPATLRPKVAWVGDSYTQGIGLTYPWSLAMLIGQALGWDVIGSGIGGTAWSSTGSNLPATRVANDILKRTQAPFDKLVWDLGYNEGGSPNPATITANINAAVAAINAVKADTQHIFIGPATPLGTTSGLDTVRSTVMAAAAALGATFIDMRDVVNADNKALYTGADNIHANQAGGSYRARRALERFIAAGLG